MVRRYARKNTWNFSDNSDNCSDNCSDLLNASSPSNLPKVILSSTDKNL